MNVYEQLMKTGYYLGSSREIFNPLEITKLSCGIHSDIDYNFQNDVANDWDYTICCHWPDRDISKNKDIHAHEVPNKLKQIKEEGAEITQSWYYKRYCNLKDVPINPEIVYSKLNSYVAKIYNLDVSNVAGFPKVTYYTKGDFIAVHKDGRNQNRICGILVYLNSPDAYQEDYGGRLLLQPANEYQDVGEWDFDLLPTKVDPISNNMVVIDFTKHNILHAVEKCYTNFYRTAILVFFHLQKPSGL